MVLILVALVIMVGLTVDLGNEYVTHLRMRNAVDMATLSMRSRFPFENTEENKETERGIISDVVYRNGIRGTKYTLSIEWQVTDDGESVYGAKIYLERIMHAYFSAFYKKADSLLKVGNLITVTENESGSYEHNGVHYDVVIVDLT